MKRQILPSVGVPAEDGPAPCADGTRHTLTYGQYRLSYEVYGSGDRVLVWMHGLLLDANLSRGLARRLAAKNNRVVLLDLLGHDRSDKPRHAGPHRMDLYAEQVLCLLDELGADQVVLEEVSLGTNVSLLATVQAPDRVHAWSWNAGARVGCSGGRAGVRAAPAGGPLRPGRAAAGLPDRVPPPLIGARTG